MSTPSSRREFLTSLSKFIFTGDSTAHTTDEAVLRDTTTSLLKAADSPISRRDFLALPRTVEEGVKEKKLAAEQIIDARLLLLTGILFSDLAPKTDETNQGDYDPERRDLIVKLAQMSGLALAPDVPWKVFLPFTPEGKPISDETLAHKVYELLNARIPRYTYVEVRDYEGRTNFQIIEKVLSNAIRDVWNAWTADDVHLELWERESNQVDVTWAVNESNTGISGTTYTLLNPNTGKVDIKIVDLSKGVLDYVQNKLWTIVAASNEAAHVLAYLFDTNYARVDRETFSNTFSWLTLIKCGQALVDAGIITNAELLTIVDEFNLQLNTGQMVNWAIGQHINPMFYREFMENIITVGSESNWSIFCESIAALYAGYNNHFGRIKGRDGLTADENTKMIGFIGNFDRYMTAMLGTPWRDERIPLNQNPSEFALYLMRQLGFFRESWIDLKLLHGTIGALVVNADGQKLTLPSNLLERRRLSDNQERVLGFPTSAFTISTPWMIVQGMWIDNQPVSMRIVPGGTNPDLAWPIFVIDWNPNYADKILSTRILYKDGFFSTQQIELALNVPRPEQRSKHADTVEQILLTNKSEIILNANDVFGEAPTIGNTSKNLDTEMVKAARIVAELSTKQSNLQQLIDHLEREFSNDEVETLLIEEMKKIVNNPPEKMNQEQVEALNVVRQRIETLDARNESILRVEMAELHAVAEKSNTEKRIRTDLQIAKAKRVNSETTISTEHLLSPEEKSAGNRRLRALRKLGEREQQARKALQETDPEKLPLSRTRDLTEEDEVEIRNYLLNLKDEDGNRQISDHEIEQVILGSRMRFANDETS